MPIFCDSLAALCVAGNASPVVAVPIGIQSFHVRDFDRTKSKAKLLNLWYDGNSNGAFAMLTNNQFVDQQRGVVVFSLNVNNQNQIVTPVNVMEPLFPREKLFPKIQAESVDGNTNDLLIADIFYEDCPNVGNTTFIGWPEFCARRGRHLTLAVTDSFTQNNYSINLALPFSKRFGVTIGALDTVNYFKPYHWYAVRGAVLQTETPGSIVNVIGSPWGNGRLTIPVFNGVTGMQEWFPWKARESGLPLIPIFQGVDAEKIWLETLTVLGESNVDGLLYLSELDS